MAASNLSPNRDNYPIMRGHVLFMRAGTSVWRHIGNVPQLTYKPVTEKLEHVSSMSGIKTIDLTVIVSKGGELTIMMDEATADNMAIALMGEVTGIPAVPAQGILTITSTNNALNTETVVIDGKTYTFQTVLTNVNGNVLIGADKAASLLNLANAINLGAGAGTTYAAATTVHPTVSAVAGTSPLIVNAKTGGVAGNSIATTETITNGSWGNATLIGGTDEDRTGDLHIGIFTHNVISGALRFYGNNDIGPKFDLDIYQVDIVPAGQMNFISNAFDQIEVTAQVVPVAGLFGTATQIIVPRIPENLPNQLPYITGTAKVGQSLTANEGVWRFQTAFAYQWFKGGVVIAGATFRSYTPVVGDVGGLLTVTITASNTVGSASATSAATAAVAA